MHKLSIKIFIIILYILLINNYLKIFYNILCMRTMIFLLQLKYRTIFFYLKIVVKFSTRDFKKMLKNKNIIVRFV